MRLASALRASMVGLAIGGVALAAPTPASALHAGSSLRVDVGLFYDDLSPHGRWIEDASYGWVWLPRVSSGWRPYTLGHWVWTDDYGWLWVSDEDFGWAVYHYGRWYYQPAYGWAWVPGFEWGPSWCSFRSGGGYIGWAPLPPRVGWQVGLGFRGGGVGFDAYIRPDDYTFVPAHAFVDHAIPRHVVPASRNTTIINVTTNVTNYTTVRDRVVNRSFRVNDVEKVVKKRVPRIRTVEVDSVRTARGAKVTNDQVPVFRPQVREAKSKVPPHGKPLATREATRSPQANERRDDRDRATAAERQREEDQRAEARAREQRARDQRADAERAAREKRAGEAKREAEARQQQEKRRQEDLRAAEKRREDEAKRAAENRRALEKRREDEAKRAAENRRAQEERRAAEQRQEQRGRAATAERQRQESAQRSRELTQKRASTPETARRPREKAKPRPTPSPKPDDRS